MNHLDTTTIQPTGLGTTLFVPALVRPDRDDFPEQPSMTNLGHRLGVYLSLVIALRAKHAPTAAHCLRVAQNLSAWGLYFQLPSEQIEQFELAGLLHDIGKVGIPERILQKPSQLLPEERVLVEDHPQMAVEILCSAGVHPEIIESIEHLACWFDNSNRNGQSSPLPLTQRILAIVDAFDAMTSEQSYRPAMTNEQALVELGRMSGRQFDPKLVASFAEVVTNSNDTLRRHVEARWLNSGMTGSMVHLFQHQVAAERSSNVAIQSLSQIFHRQMMDHMNDGVIFVDTELRILEWNKAAEHLTGLHHSAILHTEWIPDLVGLSDEQGRAIATENCPIKSVLRTSQPATRRFLLKQLSGKRLLVETQLMPILDDSGTLRGGAMLLGDASEQAGLEEKLIELHTLATQDSLTKVANRSELNRRLPIFVREAQTTRKSASVLICDIDFFKRINDTFGHAAGDEALKVFAAVLRDLSRNTDLVARYGGEEFVILCHDCDLVSAVRIGETLRQRLQATPVAALKGKCMTASFGVSEIIATDAAEDPLERADQALLQAKQTGRDRVVSISGNDSTTANATKKSKPENKQANTSWLSWLGTGEVEPMAKADLISNVPRGIAIEKLKGFIADSKAEIIHIETERVHLRVDCRNAPMTRRDADRPTVFEIKIDLEDIDVAGIGRADGIQRQTRLKLEIFAGRNRDRRTDALVDQANRLRHSFQAYLVAHEISNEMRERLIPVYKPGADGR